MDVSQVTEQINYGARLLYCLAPFGIAMVLVGGAKLFIESDKNKKSKIAMGHNKCVTKPLNAAQVEEILKSDGIDKSWGMDASRM